MSTEGQKEEEEAPTPSLLRQTLLTVDEVFVYKIPPLRSSGGHRAEDWDLANPLQTCGFQIERRGNDLYLLFTTDNHTKLFALSEYKCTPTTSQSSVTSVVDSSRYFVTQLVQQKGGGGKTAWIGFGFRQRETAVDLLGTLQQFSRSIERELIASKAVQHASEQFQATKLQDGEKIHISFGGGSNHSKQKQKRDSKTTSGSTSLLLKKPPGYEETLPDSNEQGDSTPPPAAAAAAAGTTESTNGEPRLEQICVSLGDVEIEHKVSRGCSDSTAGEISEAAMANSVENLSSDVEDDFDDDEDDWNDFQGAPTG